MPLLAYVAVVAPALMVGLHVAASSLEAPPPLAYSREAPTIAHPSPTNRDLIPVLTQRQGLAPPASVVAQAAQQPSDEARQALAQRTEPVKPRAAPPAQRITRAPDAASPARPLARERVVMREQPAPPRYRQPSGQSSEVLAQFGPPRGRGGGNSRGRYAYDRVHSIY